MILAALRVLICFVVYGVNLVEVNLVIIRSPHLMCREQPALVENIVIFQNDSEKLPCFCYVMREVFCSYGREFKVHNVHPNVGGADDTEEDTRAGDRQHGESGIRHILLGFEVILGIFINVSGAIGGSRATRNPREMNLTHVTWWLIYIWFGSFCVVFAIGLTILG